MTYAYLEMVCITLLTAGIVALIALLSLTGHTGVTSLNTALGALVGWLARSAAANGKDAWLEATKKIHVNGNGSSDGA